MMKLTSSSFNDGDPIPAQYAFCVPDVATHARFSDNRNPHLIWENAPAATKSFVLICHDPDVPSKPDDVNQEDRNVPADLPRVDFFHWVLVDIPPDITSLAEGSHSSAVQARGKDESMPAQGVRHGINDYTNWFAGDGDMDGQYFGYDGPCPPWNDSIVHHYVFTLYALDIAQCPVEGAFTGADVREAIQGHILAKAGLTGLYSMNPDVNP